MTTSRTTFGIISDTHSWLDPEVAVVFEGVDHILHAGDIGSQEVIDGLEAIAPTTCVKGNIDGGDLRFLPEEVVVEIGTKKVAMRHIAGSPKRPNKATRDFLSRTKPDVLVVGHSHIAVVAKVHGVLWLNPGAAGRHGFHTERYALLLHFDHDTEELALDRVHFGPRVGLAKGHTPS